MRERRELPLPPIAVRFEVTTTTCTDVQQVHGFGDRRMASKEYGNWMAEMVQPSSPDVHVTKVTFAGYDEKDQRVQAASSDLACEHQAG